MGRKKRKKVTFAEKVRRIKKAGLGDTAPINERVTGLDEIVNLDTRIRKVLNIFEEHEKRQNTMLYFVMYDIENDKIRTQISKFLIKKGCVRIQKSIFLADTKRPTYTDIHETLKEVQDVYDNHDSIFLVPISSDDLRSMKIIGENIDFDLTLGNKNTLFF